MAGISNITSYTSLISFMLGFPTAVATYYQAYKTRQEARLAREGQLHSANCLEFVIEDGTCVNLVPLESLHSMPKPGDIVLLPGDGAGGEGLIHTAAYKVEHIEHVYTHAETKSRRPREARLTKAIALVSSLHAQ